MTLIYFILMLGIIVFIHELGHFIWAKASGVYCYEFSLGFGPKLFSFKRKNKNDETLYCVRIIPIGGYVAMAGEEVDDDTSVPVDKKMYNKPWLKRLMIVIAGAVNNFILGFVVLFVMALVYGAVSTKPIVGIVAENSASSKAGIKIGDVITKVNGKKVKSWDDVTINLAIHDNSKETAFIIKRDGKEQEIKVKPYKNVDNSGNVTYSYGMGIKPDKKYGLVDSLKYATSKFGSVYN